VESILREALATWEKTAGRLAEATVRDPRTLALGAGFLRTMLETKRAQDRLAAEWLSFGLKVWGAR
jgi:hypothetical protein